MLKEKMVMEEKMLDLKIKLRKNLKRSHSFRQ
jgi:hypothetical protein